VSSRWRAIILAAGRGADDPMARAFGVAHKCTIPIAGKPMLDHVTAALRGTAIARPYVVSIDDPSVLAPDPATVTQLRSGRSAPTSALEAIAHVGTFPVLITTGDHPLLTPAMINHMTSVADASTADVLVGLATADVILAEYPDTKRTWFNLGGTRVSGCNLFAVMNSRGLKLLEAWQELEKNRKKPWKLVFAFGLKPLLLFATGQLTPERAFNHISQKLGIIAKPVFLPFAEAAIDVDKPSDFTLAEAILKKRQTSSSPFSSTGEEGTHA
jgi:GTP:adenosylcobinamide-phosphate guanylyltransferase